MWIRYSARCIDLNKAPTVFGRCRVLTFPWTSTSFSNHILYPLSCSACYLRHPTPSTSSFTLIGTRPPYSVVESSWIHFIFWPQTISVKSSLRESYWRNVQHMPQWWWWTERLDLLIHFTQTETVDYQNQLEILTPNISYFTSHSSCLNSYLANGFPSIPFWTACSVIEILRQNCIKILCDRT